MPSVLTIAGFDPSSGAGVTADLMTFAAHGLFGTACITALTIQNTVEVRSVEAVSAEQVRSTLDVLTRDIRPRGIKIGMLATADIVRAVASFLRDLPYRREIHVVLDPVVRSSSGRELLSPEGVGLLREQLLPEVDWITPNLDEAGVLLNREPPGADEVSAAAADLQRGRPSLNVIVTGGHLASPDDLVLLAGGTPQWIRGTRVESSSTHGTGCAYASALLSRLVLGDSPTEAPHAAKRYVGQAICCAVPIGSGRGPLQHLWPLQRAGS
jgi:hydroxymethylpyrimidine/phosphomethylpyrimidine kinase